MIFFSKIYSDNELDYIITCNHFYRHLFYGICNTCFRFWETYTNHFDRYHFLIDIVFWLYFLTKLYLQFPFLASTVWTSQYCVTSNWSITFKNIKKNVGTEYYVTIHTFPGRFFREKLQLLFNLFLLIKEVSCTWRQQCPDFKCPPKRS